VPGSIAGPAHDFTIGVIGSKMPAFAFRYPGSRFAFAGAPFPDQSAVATAGVLVAAAGAFAAAGGTAPCLLDDHVRKHLATSSNNPDKIIAPPSEFGKTGPRSRVSFNYPAAVAIGRRPRRYPLLCAGVL
jgi:hypothetical protein